LTLRHFCCIIFISSVAILLGLVSVLRVPMPEMGAGPGSGEQLSSSFPFGSGAVGKGRMGWRFTWAVRHPCPQRGYHDILEVEGQGRCLHHHRDIASTDLLLPFLRSILPLRATWPTWGDWPWNNRNTGYRRTVARVFVWGG